MWPLAMTTRSTKPARIGLSAEAVVSVMDSRCDASDGCVCCGLWCLSSCGLAAARDVIAVMRDQADRAISTGQLHALPRFHTPAYRRGGLSTALGETWF